MGPPILRAINGRAGSQESEGDTVFLRLERMRHKPAGYPAEMTHRSDGLTIKALHAALK
jgi:hypothetical protein